MLACSCIETEIEGIKLKEKYELSWLCGHEISVCIVCFVLGLCGDGSEQLGDNDVRFNVDISDYTLT